MEILTLVLVLYLLFKPNHNTYKRRGGSKKVPPANYIVDIKVPKQPRVGD